MPADRQNAGEGDQEPMFKESLFQSVKDLFTTSKYSDLTIIREDREWHVHKNIVCSRSAVFAKMCDIGMKESNENVIRLKEDEPAAVDAMLHYMYSADYNDEMQNTPAPMLLDLAVYGIADKYDVPGLTKLAASKFSKRAHDEWKTKRSDFACAIHDVYTDAADRSLELCDCILEICSTNAKALFEDDSFKEFRDVVKTVPAFAVELCAKTASLVPAPKAAGSALRFHCPSCAHLSTCQDMNPNLVYRCLNCSGSWYGKQWRLYS